MHISERRKIKRQIRQDIANIKQSIPYDNNGRIVLQLKESEVKNSFFIDANDDSVSFSSGFREYLSNFRDSFGGDEVIVDIDTKTSSSNVDKFKKLYTSFFKYDIIKTTKELRTNFISTLGCFAAGIVVLLIIILAHVFIKDTNTSAIIVAILDVLSWVFMWEAFDLFIFARPKLRRKLRHTYNMYMAEITTANINVNIKHITFKPYKVKLTKEEKLERKKLKEKGLI